MDEGKQMATTRTLVAATPEILDGFLQNRLERDYFIYCQFSKECCLCNSIISCAKGIEFKPEYNNNVRFISIDDYF